MMLRVKRLVTWNITFYNNDHQTKRNETSMEGMGIHTTIIFKACPTEAQELHRKGSITYIRKEALKINFTQVLFYLKYDTYICTKQRINHHTMQNNLTEQQEADFMLLYGFIFSMSMCGEYLNGIQPILKAHNGRNALTKVLQAETVVSAVKGTIWHYFTKSMPPEQVAIFEQAIESHSETVYKMFSLDPEKQRKVWELIEQLNNNS